MRPIYLLQCDSLGSTSSFGFEGGSFNAVRGFYGAPVEPTAFMQVAFDSNIQMVLNVSFENKCEGTGFKGLKIKQPIGNSIINLSLDAFERYGYDAAHDTGTRYSFKPIKRLISSSDPIWASYSDGFLPIRDFLKDINPIDEYQQNNSAFTLGQSQKEPLIKKSVLSYRHITAVTSHELSFAGFLPGFVSIPGSRSKQYGSNVRFTHRPNKQFRICCDW